MKIKWRYPHGECWLEQPDNCNWHRVNAYLEIRVLEKSIASTFEKKPTGDIAFVVPIFRSRGSLSFTKEITILGYIKRAFWLAYEIAHFTDLIETGTGFYIAIESGLRPLLEPYRQACGFPEDRILVTDNLSEKFNRYMSKIAMIVEACKNTTHQYYLNLDTGIHFGPERRTLSKGLQNDWHENPNRILISGNPWGEKLSILGKSTVQYNIASLGYDPTPFYTQMSRFFGLKTYEELLGRVLNPTIVLPGWCYGIPRKHIESEGFQEFYNFVERTKCLSMDESFIAFYWHRYLAPDRSYLVHSKNMDLDKNVPFSMFGLKYSYIERHHRNHTSITHTPYKTYAEYVEHYANLSDQ